MSGTSGIGGLTPPGNPSGPSDTEGVSAGSGGGHFTLGQLKKLLVSAYGEQKGTKMFNSFIQSFAMMMLQTVQDSAQQAQQASQSMMSGPPQ